jgi:hypothetical protein
VPEQLSGIVLLPMKISEDQANLVVGNLFGERFLERLEAFHAQALAGLLDFFLMIAVNPAGLEVHFAPFDHRGDHGDNAAQLPVASLSDLFESAT